jgi:hypothetical protein
VKATVQAIIFALMVGGIFAAGVNPTHSNATPIFGEGSAPRPLCAPGDPYCKPSPLFPQAADKTVAEGSAPRPLCAPGDPYCKPSPLFPQATEKMPAILAEGSAPRPLCAPGDPYCKPSPLFPQVN